MTDKKLYSKTEGRLYRYYRNLKEIDKLEYKCMTFEKQREEIRHDIRSTNISIEVDANMAVGYDERVQTSPSGVSYAEGEIIRQITKLEKEWKEVRKKVLKIHAKIRNIKKENTDLDYIIRILSTECRAIAELKYKDELSLEEIGYKMHMAKSCVRNKRDKIVNHVSTMLKW